MGITEDRQTTQKHFCAFCNGPGTTRHHLYPRAFVRRHIGLPHFQSDHYAVLAKTVRACWPCHNDMHRYFANSELAKQFNTLEILKAELERRRSQKAIQPDYEI